LPGSNSVEEFARLVEIIARLRGPDGCPWDKKQTHTSLREYLLQESYEVLEALDEADHKKLCQEMGDLMLQIILHSQIASENREFTLQQVLHNINAKLVRRHPHVFGDTRAAGVEEVSHNWEAIKKGERSPGTSMLGSVPRHMPALAYSQEIQRRVAQIGFDWKNIDGVIEKLAEEVKELQKAEGPDERSDEFGDLFFTLANVARRMGIDPEASLRQANSKFYRRFNWMEKYCRERGLELGQLCFDDQNALWEKAKREVENET
jgi:tetrapyrrole methylase family protein/MazG family protein